MANRNNKNRQRMERSQPRFTDRRDNRKWQKPRRESGKRSFINS